MRRLIFALLGVLIFASSANASYINFSAGMMVPDSSAGPTMGVCNAASSPACSNNTHVYASFSGSTDQTGWITTTLPQDAPAAPFMRCGYSFYQTTASTNPVSFKFSFQAMRDTADGTPSSAGNTTAVLTYATPSGTNETINHQLPGGTAVAVYDPVAAGACASSACSGRDIHIKVQRVPTDASDTNAQATLVKGIVCEICSNSGCS